MPHKKTTYYGSKISDNMVKTPEGFLICRNVPVARTGKQQYLGTEIGLNDREIHDVDRVEEEVFAPATIASFEGKPFTDDHPSQEVTPDNATNYVKGTVHNVRRGTGADSDYLMADIIVYDSQVIREIEDGKREISCGYECVYEPDSGGYRQTGIVGNHVALVDRGRAGEKVVIRDSKENLKEGEKMHKSKSKFWANLLGIVQDNAPEELEDAVDAMLESCNNVAGMVKQPEQEDAEPQPMPKQVPQAQPQPMPAPQPAPQATPAQDPDAEQQEEAESNHLEERIARLERLVKQLVSGGKEEEPAKDSMEDLESELTGDEDEIEDLPEEEPENDFVDDEDGLEDYSEEEQSDVIEEDCKDEEIPDELEEQPETAGMSAQDCLTVIRQMKPILATIPSEKQRRKASDTLAKLLRAQAGIPERKRGNVYAGIRKSSAMHSNDSASEDLTNLGKQWAAKYNPHYNKR